MQIKPVFVAIVLSAAFAVLGSALATPSLAASRLACAKAIQRACGNVMPSGGRLEACFQSHFKQLTKPCGNRLARAASLARACEADARQFCGDVRRATDVLACMKPRLRDVSGPCKAALAKAGVRSPIDDPRIDGVSHSPSAIARAAGAS